jgi:hypothetical protein
VEYYEQDGYRILIPHLFGAKSPKKAVTNRVDGRREWAEKSFFEDVGQKLTTQEAKSIRKIYDYFKEQADVISWGRGKGTGSFNPKVNSISARSLFTINTEGKFYVNYIWLNDDDYSIQCVQLLKAKLETIEPFRQKLASTTAKFPGFSISSVIPRPDTFLQKMTEFFEECQELEPRKTI